MIAALVLVFVTMVATDCLGVAMVQAEARDRGWLAGWMDTAQYPIGIITTTIMVTILQRHSLTEKILAMIVVSIANLGGTKLGQVIGSHFITDESALSLKDRVARLESVAFGPKE